MKSAPPKLLLFPAVAESRPVPSSRAGAWQAARWDVGWQLVLLAAASCEVFCLRFLPPCLCWRSKRSRFSQPTCDRMRTLAVASWQRPCLP